MVQELTITRIGNSEGVVLPKAILNKLRIAKGDKLYLVESEDGFRLTAFDPAFSQQLATADSLTKRYRNTLKALAE